MNDVRCIGICTGGGDAPGLNAVIRAAVKCAFLKYNWKVIGIPDGFDGLIWPEKSYELTLKHVSGILPRGGTILGTTNRGNSFKYCTVENGQEVTRDISDEVIGNARKLGDGRRHQHRRRGLPDHRPGTVPEGHEDWGRTQDH
jgi:6-phosphofructokinase 1